MKLTLENGKDLTITSLSMLQQELKTLGQKGNRFAVLSLEDEFIQTMGDKTGTFILEKQHSNGDHFRADKEDFTLTEIISIFSNYYLRDTQWENNLKWDFLDDYSDHDHDNADQESFLSRWAFKLGGALFALYGIYNLGNTVLFLSDTIKTQATVIQFVSMDDDKALKTPRYSFEVEGQTYQGQSETYSRTQPYNIGEKIEILYKSNAPSETRINNFFDLWLAPLLMLSLGLGLASAGSQKTLIREFFSLKRNRKD